MTPDVALAKFILVGYMVRFWIFVCRLDIYRLTLDSFGHQLSIYSL
jgi:hypothetical protein|tara:strand:+ start:385 stop:522 length:138 start_codon:yes stop_codon:yes gene_type:complete